MKSAVCAFEIWFTAGLNYLTSIQGFIGLFLKLVCRHECPRPMCSFLAGAQYPPGTVASKILQSSDKCLFKIGLGVWEHLKQKNFENIRQEYNNAFPSGLRMGDPCPATCLLKHCLETKQVQWVQRKKQCIYLYFTL